MYAGACFDGRDAPADERRQDDMDKKSEADIARRAYEIWERQGRPHGRDFDHWLEAERQEGGDEAAQPESREMRSPEPSEQIRPAQSPSAPRGDQTRAADTRPCRPRKAEQRADQPATPQPATPAMPAKARRPSTAPRKPPRDQD
jgi:hypothetical protein